jgi:hypothetical protein
MGDDSEAASVHRRDAHTGLGDSNHRSVEQGGKLVGSRIAKGANDDCVGTLRKQRRKRAYCPGGFVELNIAGDERRSERCRQAIDAQAGWRKLTRDLD